LILSEFAGASKELLEARIVHPYRPTEVADAIARALAMDAAERRARSDPMVRRLRAGDARAWGRRFLERLDHAVSVGEGLRTRPLGPEPRRELVRAYEEAHRRLLLLDYDGTLVGLVDDPVRAAPPAEMTGLLRRLAARDGNEVVIVSGRPRPILEEWFGDLGVALCAEHGAWFRAASGEPWEAAPRADGTWKEVLRGVMQLTVQRIPGSFIEEKDYCLAWHYRRANGPIANDAARELFDTLVNLTASTDAAVQAGKGVVEVRCAGITKGQFYASHLAGGAWDFEFAAGDDATDETLFRALPPNAWSVHVGSSATAARHRLTAPQDLVRLLDDLEPRVAAAEGRGRGLPPEVARQAWDRSVPAEH
ncbi:MAG TPA: trehalose-phosphatase, partial [Candidatus Thermoplasmatota archaeon]